METEGNEIFFTEKLCHYGCAAGRLKVCYKDVCKRLENCIDITSWKITVYILLAWRQCMRVSKYEGTFAQQSEEKRQKAKPQ